MSRGVTRSLDEVLVKEMQYLLPYCAEEEGGLSAHRSRIRAILRRATIPGLTIIHLQASLHEALVYDMSTAKSHSQVWRKSALPFWSIKRRRAAPPKRTPPSCWKLFETHKRTYAFKQLRVLATDKRRSREMSSKTFNVAVVGYGLSAKVFHIPLILALPSEFKLYGIVQRSPKLDDDCAKDHPGIKSWRSIDEVYKDEAVDVVVITSIPETHFDMCKASLEAGKNVVCEKPFVPTSKEADELAKIAQKNGKLLTVYQNRRWDSDFLTLKKTIADGALGDIAEFETHFDRHRPDTPAESWKTQEGVANGAVYDLGSHLMDQVYSLYGMPEKITATVGAQRRGAKGGPPDSFTAWLRYGQMLATVKAGVVSPEDEQLRYWVRGTKGSFRKVSSTSNHRTGVCCIYSFMFAVPSRRARRPVESRGETRLGRLR